MLLDKGKILKIYSRKMMGFNGNKIHILSKNNDLMLILFIFNSFNCLSLLSSYFTINLCDIYNIQINNKFIKLN
jgi:hypothetical protein